jgi:hypothetical protein
MLKSSRKSGPPQRVHRNNCIGEAGKQARVSGLNVTVPGASGQSPYRVPETVAHQ